MSERYWVTGVQIGMISSFSGTEVDEILKEVQDKQFIGNMREPYDDYEIVIKKKE
jgi:hypothetical protein